MLSKTETEHQLEAAKHELEALRLEFQRIEQSSSYLLGRLLISSLRSPRKLLRLPVDLVRLGKELRLRSRPPAPGSLVYSRLRRAWLELAQQAKADSAPLIFMFSGTTFIQDTRGNRPIRQTQALLRQGARVLFSYHRSRFDDPLPSWTAQGLVQMPQDVTLQLLQDIAHGELGSALKLCIISYPYPGMDRQVELFRQHGWKVIYDCRDDWEEFSRVGMARWFDAEVERSLVRQCEMTICVSAPLVRKMSGFAPQKRVELVPNAVEVDFLPEGYQHTPAEPSIIGYFGHLAEAWFDWQAFTQIAQNCPQYRFEIIGHSAPSGLQLPDNVQVLGPKPWHELHRYASRWRVAIIPFRMGPLADGVDPIKIYEYLYFGLPVVSFLMPQIKEYPYTTTVDSVETFCAALEFACSIEVNDQLIVDFIAANTWEVRAQQLLGLLESENAV